MQLGGLRADRKFRAGPGRAAYAIGCAAKRVLRKGSDFRSRGFTIRDPEGNS